MNLLVSNLLFCVAGVILAALGTEFTTDNMGPDCFPRLVAAAMMIGSYFVTSFIITAMALDRLAAIVFPFKYLEFLRGKQIRTVCVCVRSLGLFVVVSHNIINSHLMSSCISAKYLSSNVTIGIFNQNFIVNGITNLLNLILNFILFSYLFVYMVKRNYKRRMYEISTLKKLSVIFVAYVILYGPFSIVTIFLSFSQYKTARMERYANIAIVILFIAFIVDPFLYAWRYKMCRLHMMKMVCFFRKSKVNEIIKTLNDRYCTYKIEMAPRTTTTIV